MHRISVFAVIFICVWILNGVTQTVVPPDSAKIIEAARSIMTRVRYAAFITNGTDGFPQARIVDPFAPDSQMTVWVATNPLTRKVEQIRRNPKVTLFYWDPNGVSYVTLIGVAELVTDPELKARHWKEDWVNFYKDRWRGDDYVLIRIRPVRLEVVSYEFGILNAPKNWRPPAIQFQGNGK